MPWCVQGVGGYEKSHPFWDGLLYNGERSVKAFRFSRWTAWYIWQSARRTCRPFSVHAQFPFFLLAWRPLLLPLPPPLLHSPTQLCYPICVSDLYRTWSFPPLSDCCIQQC